jgi:serine phosphatase RsbU (regulator of sigma subunit)
VPVVVTATPGTALRRLARCVELGASDYITHPANATLLRARLQNSMQKKLLAEQATMALEAFNDIEKVADDLRLVILPIGAALSAEADYDRLLERIVTEARAIANADAGALFLANEEDQLTYAVIQVGSLGLAYGGTTGTPPPFPPISLAEPDPQAANPQHLAAYVALTGETVSLANIHREDGRFDLSRLSAFEQDVHYRAESALMVPLRNGQVVGALFLINSQDPISGEIVAFDAYHQQVAESLASQAAVVLNNRLLSQREMTLLRYKQEMEIARDIQLGFLPASVPQPAGWEVKAHFQPASEVAGDFYDVVVLPHDHLGLVIADVVGKGVTAALYMAIIRSLFRALFEQHYFPMPTATRAGNPFAALPTPFAFIDREALVGAVRMTNAYLTGTHYENHVFATLFCGLLNPSTGSLLYVNAGHNPPTILRAKPNGRNSRELLQPTGPAIGLLPGATYWLGEAILHPGDLLFTYTDGITDARNPAGDEFGPARLEALISQATSAAELLEAVGTAVRQYTAGAEPYDDITMLAARRLPG